MTTLTAPTAFVTRGQSLKTVISLDSADHAQDFCQKLQSKGHDATVGPCVSNQLSQFCRDHKPDILVCDHGSSGYSFHDVMRDQRTRRQPTKFLMVDRLASDMLLDFSLKSGVNGFITHDELLLNGVIAVEEIFSNGWYFSARVRDRLSYSLQGKVTVVSVRTSPIFKLTGDELAVCIGICEGRSMCEIASARGVTEKAADNIRTRAYRKLFGKRGDRVQLCRLFLREGICAL